MNQSPQEYTPPDLAPLQRVIVEMGRLGLVPETAIMAIEEDPTTLAPLADALACYVVGASATKPEQGDIPVCEVDSAREMLSNGTYPYDILEDMRITALGGGHVSGPPNQRSRVFLKSFLCITPEQAKVLETACISQQQVVAFSEKILAEYHRFSAHDYNYAFQTAQEFRMHIVGEYDTAIWHKTGATSKDAVSQFRARMRRTLLDNYPEGAQTIRTEFLRYLTLDQRATLTEVLPELFKSPKYAKKPTDA